VDDSTPIEDALDECRKRRTSGVQVARDGMLIGAADREDLGRAIAHGLAHAPVRGVMSAHVDAVAAGASLADLQRALLHSGTGRVPVTAAGGPGPHPVDAVLGVVTRGDLRRALRERTAEPPVAAAGELGERLVALPGLEQLWDAVREVAEGYEGVYLVGGAVRDVLLGEPTFDVDIAVEGDGVAFARDLASRLDGRVHVHEKFRTAVVLAQGQRVDVATARTEHYEHPAALPVVEHASIQRDLHRRDFTINAMAVDLSAERFGRLVDPFGGSEDLAAGRLRVLHNLSFIEDPTRIFRAIRYENRYGFAMAAQTRELARACVEMGLVGEVSGARVRDELVAILSEERVAGAVRRLCELGLDAEVHPGLDCGEGAAALIERMDAVRARLAPGAAVWQPRLGAIARRIPGDELVSLLDVLRIRRRDARIVAEVAAVAPRLAAPLAAAGDRARIGELLDAHPVEVAVAVAAGEDGHAASAAELYLAELRAVRLELDGNALREELGLEESPLIGEILVELVRRRRNGGVPGRDAQLAAARELAAEAVS
jgi:tRNA nucleotidyltransferase (CCA-adding enzyme)